MTKTKELVVLVDEKDQELGLMEKQMAHEKGLLHRAFSVFIFNDKNEMLLQQRAEEKYHSPLLWTNACCSHPRYQETYYQAAKRRLEEELGFVCEVQEKFNFIYQAKLGSNLWEHELDHVFVGNYNGEINFNKNEVAAIQWIAIEDLIQNIEKNPESYTVWFKIILEEYLNQLQK